MIDGALETLDLNLFKRGMFEFSLYVFVHVCWIEIVKKDRFFEFFFVFKKKRWNVRLREKTVRMYLKNC